MAGWAKAQETLRSRGVGQGYQWWSLGPWIGWHGGGPQQATAGTVRPICWPMGTQGRSVGDVI